MMAFSNDFVVCVKVKGKVQRDAKGKNGERNVFLPHHTEYSLLLKNLTDRKSAASISIDGTDALGGEKLVVPAQGSTELKRFMLDGNRENGESFCFVSVESGDTGIVDPSSPENGLIEVSFFKEKVPGPPYIYVGPSIYMQTFSSSTGATKGVADPPNIMCNYFNAEYAGSVAMDHGGAGATVEGSSVHQGFRQDNFDLESWAASTIRIRLRTKQGSPSRPVPRMRYCPMCAEKVASEWNNCAFCGYNLD